jgi:hypothetical protein
LLHADQRAEPGADRQGAIEMSMQDCKTLDLAGLVRTGAVGSVQSHSRLQR